MKSAVPPTSKIKAIKQVQVNGKTSQAPETSQVREKSNIQASASQLQGFKAIKSEAPVHNESSIRASPRRLQDCKVVKTGVQDTRKQADDGIGHYGEWRTNSHRLYGGETYYPERATRLQRSGSLGAFWCRSIRATVGIVMCYNTRRKVNNGSYLRQSSLPGSGTDKSETDMGLDVIILLLGLLFRPVSDE